MPSLSDLDYENPVKIASTQIETVAIIGGGASGAIILDTLLKEPSNIKKIVVFERQKKLGGIWLLIKTLDRLLMISSNRVVIIWRMIHNCLIHSISNKKKLRKFYYLKHTRKVY